MRKELSCRFVEFEVRAVGGVLLNVYPLAV